MSGTKQGEIVILPFPFSDLEGNKRRPALVVSRDEFNERNSDCIAVPITSVLKNEPYAVYIEQSDLKEGTLLLPSRIRTDRLFSVEQALIQRHIGTLHEEKFIIVKSKIIALF